MKHIKVRSHQAMSGRQFLVASLGAGITAMLAGPGSGPGLGAAEPAGGNVEALFESDDPRLMRIGTIGSWMPFTGITVVGSKRP